MIITYPKHNRKCRALTVVPENIPWRLETAVGKVVEESEFDSGFVYYRLNLVVGKEMVDTLLTSEDLRGLAIKEDEEEMILAFMNEIIDLTARETVALLSRREQVLDLGTLMDKEFEFWCRFQAACREDKEE